MSMLGSRGTDDALTGLVSVVTDPQKFKKSLADLKDATEKHRVARDEAAKAKAESVAAANVANRLLAEAHTAKGEAEARANEANARHSILGSLHAALEAKTAAFEADMKAAKDELAKRVTNEEKRLSDLKDRLLREHTARAAEVNKLKADTDKRTTDLANFSRRLDTKNNQLNEREETVTKAEADLRSKVNQVNQLFAGK